MESKWQEYPLDEIANIKSGKRLPKGDTLIDCRTEYPYLRLVDVSDGKVRKDDLKYLTTDIQKRISKYIVETNDVCLAIVGHTIGMVFMIDSEFNGANLTENAARITNFRGIDPQYLYNWLSSPLGQSAIKSRIVGSAQGKLPLYNIRSLPVPLPPLQEQKAIAHILGSLDEKIELNRRMNATLEAMAQALFKSWFVDFDPVIDNALAAGNPIPPEFQARAELRRLNAEKLKSATHHSTFNTHHSRSAHLFPDSFQETEELGWIPEGWEVSTIGHETDTVGGGTPSTKNPDFWEDGEYPWVTPKDFSSLQDKVLLSSSRYLTEAGLAKVSSGLLPEGTVLMSSRAPVGYLAITQIETAINQGFIGMICNKRLPSEYVLQWANSRMIDIKQASSGSTFAEISKRTFRPFKVIVPQAEALEAYKEIASATYSRIGDNVAASETLGSLRDTLLPKLISGELRIDA